MDEADNQSDVPINPYASGVSDPATELFHAHELSPSARSLSRWERAVSIALIAIGSLGILIIVLLIGRAGGNTTFVEILFGAGCYVLFFFVVLILPGMLLWRIASRTGQVSSQPNANSIQGMIVAQLWFWRIAFFSLLLLALSMTAMFGISV